MSVENLNHMKNRGHNSQMGHKKVQKGILKGLGESQLSSCVRKVCVKFLAVAVSKPGFWSTANCTVQNFPFHVEEQKGEKAEKYSDQKRKTFVSGAPSKNILIRIEKLLFLAPPRKDWLAHCSPHNWIKLVEQTPNSPDIVSKVIETLTKIYYEWKLVQTISWIWRKTIKINKL